MSISRTAVILVCGALAGGATSPASAQQGPGESFSLSLDQALKIALENNLDLVSARYGPGFAEQDIQLQLAPFDPNFQASANFFEQKQAATQLSTVTGSEAASVNFGVQQNLKMGADYVVGFGMTRSDQSGPNVVAPLSYDSGFNFQFNLPLLKGFGTEVTTEQLVLSQSDYDISLSDLEAQAENVMESVEGAYWDVIAAREALRVAQESLERARDLLELNRKKVEVGTLAPIEITQAEAGVASEEEGVIVAEEALANAEDELRRLLAIPQDDPRWEQSIVPADRPDFTRRETDLEAAIDTALEQRPEIEAAQQTVKNRELSERVADRETKHQLDFRATYEPSGASLTFTDPGPDNIPGTPDDIPISDADLGDSISGAFDRDQYTWSTGLVYTVPIGNRAAKATYERARLAREQSEVDLQNSEQTIRVEVRTAVRAVDSGFKRFEAAAVNVELQGKKLDAEQKKFENGMSTTFEVRQFQNDLSEAQLSQIRAGLDYAKALAALERVKGTLLESHNLSVSP
jgi:outer membrane protein TolC